MKLINCHIENFGKLHDFSIDFSDGENMIYHENGWGKTTFAAFLRAMFYGLDGERKRSLEENERKRYTPWQGGAFGGKITFEVNGKRYIATRFFGEQEEFELRDADTNLISTDYSSNLGEELFEINRESFVRTIFIGQNDCTTSGADDIHAKISNLTDNTNDLNNYEKASETLTKILNSMTPKRSTGTLARRKNDITQLERKVLEGEAIEKSIESYQDYLQREQERSNACKNELKKTTELQKQVSGMRERMLQKEQWEELKDTYGKREQEMLAVKSCFGDEVPAQDTVEEMLHVSKELRNKKEQLVMGHAKLDALQPEEDSPQHNYNQWVLTVSGVILMAVAIVLMMSVSFEIGLALVVVGIILTVIGIITSSKAMSEKQAWNIAEEQKRIQRQETQKHIDSIEKEMMGLRNQLVVFLGKHGVNVQDETFDEHLFEFKNQISRHQYAVQLWQEARERLKEFENHTNITELMVWKPQEGMPSLEELNARILQLNEEMELIHKTIQGYNQNLERLQMQYDEWEDNKLYLEQLKRVQKEEETKYKHIELTKKYLGMAKESLTTKYVGPILNNFAQYYESVTSYSDNDFHMDANMDITIDAHGKQREVGALSCGYQDLIGICLRVSLVDAMYTGEKPMLIMDDPFTNLDDEKLIAAKALLSKISEGYQVIYFTCSSARV